MTPPDTEDRGVEAGGDVLAFVTVTAAGMAFALPLSEVLEVIRPPDLVRIPLGPPSLKGLAQRQGVAMPVLDLRRALGRDGERDGDAADTLAARVIVVSHYGQPVGLLVDGMAGMVRTTSDRIDDLTDAEAPAVDAALLAGMLRDGAVTVLNSAALIDRQFGDLWSATATRAVSFAAAAQSSAISAVTADEARLVVFQVAGQEFALPVERVQEILPAPSGITRMAKSKAHLLGVIPLRDRLLPLVGLRALFGLDEGAGRRVVVVRAGEADALVGVMVDEVREILRIDRALIDPVPPLLAREPEFEDLDGIARADGGRRLVSVLSAGRMFRHGLSLGAAALGTAPGTNGEVAMAGRSNTAHDGAGAVERFVVFRLAGAEYGLPVAAVQEVLRRPDTTTPLPNAPDFVAGVLTLRGAVLPLIDQRRLLNLPAGGASGDRGRVVVVAQGEARVGLLVDGLAGLLAVAERDIGPAPAVSEAQQRLIRRVVTLKTADGASRLILLMDTESLLDMDRLSALLPSL